MRALNYPALIFFALIIFLLFTFKSRAAEPTKVMIIDTGVEAKHPSLKNWKKYYFDKIDITPDNLHGTAMASLVLNGELNEDMSPTSPVCDSIQVIFCNYKFTQQSTRLFYCLQAAVDQHVDVINFSSVGYEFMKQEYQLIQRLSMNGTLFVTAAGNDAKDVKKFPSFPAMYRFTDYLSGAYKALPSLTNIIAVTATHHNGVEWAGANYGLNFEKEVGVDVRAAAFHGSEFTTGVFTGTSASTALYTNKLLRKKCEVLNATK